VPRLEGSPERCSLLVGKLFSAQVSRHSPESSKIITWQGRHSRHEADADLGDLHSLVSECRLPQS
jgi:hypothetical protein